MPIIILRFALYVNIFFILTFLFCHHSVAGEAQTQQHPIYNRNADRGVVYQSGNHKADGRDENGSANALGEGNKRPATIELKGGQHVPQIKYQKGNERQYAGLHGNLKIHVVGLCDQKVLPAVLNKGNIVVLWKHKGKGVRTAS